MIQESLEDFRKRYKGTYLFLKIRGEDMLVRYESDNEEDFCFYSGVYGDILVDEETARENISFIFPKSGLYNVKGQAMFFSRNPQRQWKRAPCGDNVSLTPILQELGLNFRNEEIGMPVMEQIFSPQFVSLDKAAGYPLSVALTRDFAVSESTFEDPNERILWFHTSPIGMISLDTKTINVKYQAFYQETLDFIRKADYNWTVTRN